MDSVSSTAFSSALVYQGLSSQTPQELQTEGVLTIPTSPAAAPTIANTTTTGSTTSTTSSSSTASTDGTASSDSTDSAPSLGLSSAKIASLQASVQNSASNPFMLANTYQILNNGTGTSISMMGASSASVGQQIDTTA